MKQQQRRQQPRQKKNSKVKFNPSQQQQRVNFEAKQKPTSVSDMDRKLETASKAFNDISWYTKNAQLLRDAASLPMNTQLGNRLFPNRVGSAGNDAKSVPGILSIEFVPSFGITEADNNHSPLDVALTNIYSFVRHANSGSANYDRVDLGLYLICSDSAFMFYNWMQRLYGICMTFNGYNRYIPQALVKANYVNYDDILMHLNDFRAFMNQFALRCDCLWIPSNMPIFVRHSWMVSNVYKDSENDRSQLYQFVPNGFYRYDETSSSSGGFAKFVPFNFDTPLSYNDIVNYGNSIINSLLDSEDIGIIAGDIRKAYGESNLFSVNTTSEDYRVEPVYNSEVLMQIENSNAFGSFGTSWERGGFDITQDVDNQSLIFNPECVLAEDSFGHATQKIFLNFHHDNVTPEDIMIATRLTTQYSAVEKPAQGLHCYIQACGSEIVTRYRYFQNLFTENGRILSDVPFSTFISASFADYISDLVVFRCRPAIYFQKKSGPTNSPIYVYSPFPAVEVDNFTYVEENTMVNLHTTALFSELGVPIN
nr:putative capsid [Marmot picobirnavirus]